MASVEASSRQTASIWRNRDFLWFWGGQSVSMVGTQITTFAVPVLAITALGADAGQLSLLRTMEFLPFLFLTLPVGLWVDRHPPRPAMIAANLLRGVLIALIAVAGITGMLGLSWLAVALLLIGAGPGLAGGLVQVITAPVTLLVDAFSYLFSVFTLKAIRTPDSSLPGSRSRRSGCAGR